MTISSRGAATMPPRRSSQSASLTPEDLTSLAAEVAQGRRPTVYLREGIPGLDLEPGTSARVLSVSGSTVTVSPRGVDDELPYEANELRRTKNEAPARSSAPRSSAAKSSTGNPHTATATTPNSAARQRRTRTPETSTAQSGSSRTDAPARSSDTEPKSKRAPVKKAAKTVSVTIYGSADNQWFVSMTRGAHKPQRARAVTVESVDAAMRELGDSIVQDAVTSVMTAAREEAKRRVDDLSRELEQAREALAALDSH
ncbi:DUF6319 family protein [Gordonia sp. DT30]|uniref:DUF6319 family protein n=1 Tax=unclassified Gordonia (in: high G+C Gram-positive bacteria) TaxID=2657482 RepID=UPI003CF4B700